VRFTAAPFPLSDCPLTASRSEIAARSSSPGTTLSRKCCCSSTTLASAVIALSRSRLKTFTLSNPSTCLLWPRSGSMSVSWFSGVVIVKDCSWTLRCSCLQRWPGSKCCARARAVSAPTRLSRPTSVRLNTAASRYPRKTDYVADLLQQLCVCFPALLAGPSAPFFNLEVSAASSSRAMAPATRRDARSCFQRSERRRNEASSSST
jgi:hypothetical protein